MKKKRIIFALDLSTPKKGAYGTGATKPIYISEEFHVDGVQVYEGKKGEEKIIAYYQTERIL
jgi:hypothetical protein